MTTLTPSHGCHISFHGCHISLSRRRSSTKARAAKHTGTFDPINYLFRTFLFLLVELPVPTCILLPFLLLYGVVPTPWLFCPVTGFPRRGTARPSHCLTPINYCTGNVHWCVAPAFVGKRLAISSDPTLQDPIFRLTHTARALLLYSM